MYKQYLKRFFDCFLAILLLIPLLPVMLIVSVAIKLDSKGPVIFKQIRSGKDNKKFMLYKFRSMSASNDFYDKTKEDQLTRVGAFIRKTSLDELPQLFNILKGEMSFIGPRPWVLDYAKYFTEHQMRRLEVLPGITGLAQASGRNNLSILDRIEIDVKYVDNMNILMDIKIIFKTIIGILKREGFSNSKSAIHDELKLLQEQHVVKISNDKEKNSVRKNKLDKKKNNNQEKVLVGSGA